MVMFIMCNISFTTMKTTPEGELLLLKAHLRASSDASIKSLEAPAWVPLGAVGCLRHGLGGASALLIGAFGRLCQGLGGVD